MNESAFLHDQLKRISEKNEFINYLEIGVRDGDSFLVVAESNELKYAALCDNWSNAYGGTGRGSCAYVESRIVQWYNQNYRCAPEIDFITGDTADTLPNIVDSDILFDLILVDGDHSYDGAARDLRYGYQLLAPGGIIVMDDLIHPAHKYLHGIAASFYSGRCHEFSAAAFDCSGGYGVFWAQKK